MEDFAVADEILKLKKLADDGIISQKEFESRKKLLLVGEITLKSGCESQTGNKEENHNKSPKILKRRKRRKAPLTVCKGCGSEISTAVDLCPFCGKKRWKKRYWMLGFFVVLMIFLILQIINISINSRSPSSIPIQENRQLDEVPGNKSDQILDK